MSYLEELLPEFRKGAKIRCVGWSKEKYIYIPEPDWDYIIENKCLCWFWDDITEEPNFADRLLAVVENESGIKYLTKGKVSFAYCRPVRRDEVTFYEERKDE